jgi:hypothetical protein
MYISRRFTKTFLIAAAIVGLSALSGCSKQEEVKEKNPVVPEGQRISFQVLEDARATSYANGVVVAKTYIRDNPRLDGMSVVGHPDQVQSDTCPQGSGWTNVSAMKTDSETLDAKGKPTILKEKLICSSVSASIGCFREEDFKKSKYSGQEDQCNVHLPFPLPKLVGRG